VLILLHFSFPTHLELFSKSLTTKTQFPRLRRKWLKLLHFRNFNAIKLQRSPTEEDDRSSDRKLIQNISDRSSDTTGRQDDRHTPFDSTTRQSSRWAQPVGMLLGVSSIRYPIYSIQYTVCGMQYTVCSIPPCKFRARIFYASLVPSCWHGLCPAIFVPGWCGFLAICCGSFARRNLLKSLSFSLTVAFLPGMQDPCQA